MQRRTHLLLLKMTDALLTSIQLQCHNELWAYRAIANSMPFISEGTAGTKQNCHVNVVYITTLTLLNNPELR